MDGRAIQPVPDEIRGIEDPAKFAMAFCEYVDRLTSPQRGGDATRPELAIQLAFRWYFSLTMDGMASAVLQSREPLDRVVDALAYVGARDAATHVVEAAAMIREVPEDVQRDAGTMGRLAEVLGDRFRAAIDTADSARDDDDVLSALIAFINEHRSALLDRREVDTSTRRAQPSVAHERGRARGPGREWKRVTPVVAHLEAVPSAMKPWRELQRCPMSMSSFRGEQQASKAWRSCRCGLALRERLHRRVPIVNLVVLTALTATVVGLGACAALSQQPQSAGDGGDRKRSRAILPESHHPECTLAPLNAVQLPKSAVDLGARGVTSVIHGPLPFGTWVVGACNDDALSPEAVAACGKDRELWLGLDGVRAAARRPFHMGIGVSGDIRIGVAGSLDSSLFAFAGVADGPVRCGTVEDGGTGHRRIVTLANLSEGCLWTRSLWSVLERSWPRLSDYSDIVVDAQGDVFVVGTPQVPGFTSEWIVLTAIDRAGRELWNKYLGSWGAEPALAEVSDGVVLIWRDAGEVHGGVCGGAARDSRICTVVAVFDKAGRTRLGVSLPDFEFNAAAVDRRGHVYLAGVARERSPISSTTQPVGGQAIVRLPTSPEPNETWSITELGSAVKSTSGLLVVDGGLLILAGTFQGRLPFASGDLRTGDGDEDVGFVGVYDQRGRGLAGIATATEARHQVLFPHTDSEFSVSILTAGRSLLALGPQRPSPVGEWVLNASFHARGCAPFVRATRRE